MFLVKCECGGWYTLTKDALKNGQLNRSRICPSCGANHQIEENPTLKALSATGIELIRIPDGSSIEVKFTL